MANRNITEQILRFLNPYGVGYYKDISWIIKKTFPPQLLDNTDDIYDIRIREYLDNLERSKFIKCNRIVITLETIHIEAAILDAGVRHLKTEEKSKLFKIVELLFWIAGIGVLIFMIYEHFHPLSQDGLVKFNSPTIGKDTPTINKSSPLNNSIEKRESGK